MTSKTENSQYGEFRSKKFFQNLKELAHQDASSDVLFNTNG